MAGSASADIICPTQAGPTPVNIWEYEEFASATLPKQVFDYYSSGNTNQFNFNLKEIT
jgi:hypothetical protein